MSGNRQRPRMSSFRMSDDEYAAITAAAARENLSVSAFIRETVLRAAGSPAPVTLFGTKFASEAARDEALLELQRNLDRVQSERNT